MYEAVAQPIITQAELNRIDKYHKDVFRDGYRPWVAVRQSHTEL